MILDKELYIERGFLLGILISLKNSIFRIMSKKSKVKVNELSERNRNSDFGFRGVPRLKTKEDSYAIKCTSCELCEKICPTKCISIQGHDKGTEPKIFEIDLLKCIFCGFCVEVCPEDALEYGTQKNLSGHAENNWILNKEQLALNNSTQKLDKKIEP